MGKAIVFALLYWAMPALCVGQTNQASWDNLKQLRAGQKIEVVDMKLKSLKGTFVSYSEEAISLRTDKGELGVRRADVFTVSSLEGSKRMRNTLIGMGIGAAGGLAAGAIAGAAYHEEGETGLFMLVAVPVGVGAGALVGAAIPTGTRTICRGE